MPPTRTVTILDAPTSPSSSTSPGPHTLSLTQRPKRKLKQLKQQDKPRKIAREGTKATTDSFFLDPRYAQPGSLHIKYEAQNIVDVNGKRVVYVPKGRSVVQHLPRHRRLVLSEENMCAFAGEEIVGEGEREGEGYGEYVSVGEGMFVEYEVVSAHEESWKRHWGYFESELYREGSQSQSQSESSQESTDNDNDNDKEQEKKKEDEEEKDLVLTIPLHTKVVVVVKGKAKVVRVTPESLLLLRSVEELNRAALRRAEGEESGAETEVETEVDEPSQ